MRLQQLLKKENLTAEEKAYVEGQTQYNEMLDALGHNSFCEHISVVNEE